MARWTPKADAPIGQNERIARRLFDLQDLVGAADQRPFTGLDLRHFQERRDVEFSLDRLGRSGVEKSVTNFLKPKAHRQAETFTPKQSFDGWICVKAKDFMTYKEDEFEFPLVASPIKDENDSEKDNPYHCHAVQPKLSRSTALHLRQIFIQGQHEHLPGDLPPAKRGWTGKVKAWWNKLKRALSRS